MTNSNHDLFLGMYSFQIKKKGTSDSKIIRINDFLSQAYPDKENKFQDGFVSDIISLIESKVFKNKEDTHGGLLEDKTIRSQHRYLDIMINGGITGIQQFLIDEEGNKQTITRDKTVGLKFFARFWMPAGRATAFLFIQYYSSSRLKPLFDDLVSSVLKKHDFIIANRGRKMKLTTTKKRLENFLKNSSLRDVTVISRESRHDTGVGDAQSVTVKLKNFSTRNRAKVNKKTVGDALKNHGFTLGDRYYEMSATYEHKVGDKKEERTARLDDTDNTINIIPSILLPLKCKDSDGYPDFNEMKRFADIEIEQIKTETSMR
ncbi:MAG: hypothetical protein ACK5MI_03280 [Mangrovibacterium sp.]